MGRPDPGVHPRCPREDTGHRGRASPRKEATSPRDRATAGTSAALSQSPASPGPAGSPRVLTAVGSGSAVSRCPPRCPASRGPARSPHRDSWVPKGLSPPRRAGCPPRAAPPPPAGPSAHAPARYLRWPPRSSSTWPRSPGAAPQPAPSALRRAPCWLPRRGPRRRGLGAITMY